MTIALESFLQFDGKSSPYLTADTLTAHWYTIFTSFSCFCFLVDAFYIKTCSFQREMAECGFHMGKMSLFCGNVAPKPRYTMIACEKPCCPLCHLINTAQQRIQSHSYAIDFVFNSKHEFVNAYTTYLNAPVVCFFLFRPLWIFSTNVVWHFKTCETKNIIYVMTCPCGHYDYADSTAGTLADALACKHLFCMSLKMSILDTFIEI